MEKQVKGGYILISLGLIPLSTSYSGSIDYDRISKTKKHIVLTGIKIATTVMPDIAVKPIYGNGTITFEDVYGFDVVVSSNNSVSVIEHVAPSGGTKLYKHTVSLLDNAETNVSIEVISTEQASFTSLNYMEKIIKSLSISSIVSDTLRKIFSVDYDGRYFNLYYVATSSIEPIIITGFTSDNVTEL